MQVVGRACDVCGERLSSELVAVACLRCNRAFHDACVTPAPASTYRAAEQPKQKAREPEAPFSTLCPTCGDDVRWMQRGRDEVRAKDRGILAEARRASGDEPYVLHALAGRAVVTVVMIAIGLALAWLRYR